MMIEFKGHRMFAVSAQAAAIREGSVKDVLHQLEAIKSWVEAITAEDGNHDASLRHEWSQLELNTDMLMAKLDLFAGARGHYIDGTVRRAFERNELGEITSS